MNRLLPLFPMFRAPYQRPMDGGGGAVDNKTPITMEQIKRLISREGHGDSHKAIEVLLRENRKSRKRAQDAEKKAKDLEDGKRIAPEGGAVLSAEEAKEWKVIQPYLAEQKLDGAKLIAAAKKSGELQTELDQRKGKDLIAKVAESIDYNAPALIDVLELKKLDVEMQDVKVPSDEDEEKLVTKSLPFVRAKGDDKAKWVLLTEYAEENLKTFMPALTAKDGDEETEAGTTTRTKPQGGVRIPAQSRSRKPAAPAGKTDEKIREEAIDTGAFSVL